MSLGRRAHAIPKTDSFAVKFFEVFKNIWRDHGSNTRQAGPIYVGLFVSGGADSMALARLMKHVSDSGELGHNNIEPVGFIVNHNARRESREEAEYVRSTLLRYDITSNILDMEWPSTTDPATLPNFEMQARRARYRLVAEAAIRLGIEHLFTGHHRDDQVETILMRLLRNSGDSFLGRQGIATSGAVPCCEDFHGAHNEVDLECNDSPATVSGGSLPSKSAVRARKQITLSTSAGSQLHRPLLAFPKAEILEFCNRNRIPFVQDQTNFDPTLTVRNAVRHLRTKHSLPRALKTSSVLGLMTASRQAAAALTARGDQVLKTVEIETFDLRSGRMIVFLPTAFQNACAIDLEAGAYALARLTSIVSPQSQEVMPTLLSLTNMREFVSKNSMPAGTSMSIQRIVLEKKAQDSLPARSCHAAGAHKPSANAGANSDRDDTEGTRWTFFRPMMRATEVASASMSFQLDSHYDATQDDPDPDIDLSQNRPSGFWSRWIFWDNRYWIRVRAVDASMIPNVRIRPFVESDYEFVSAGVGFQKSHLRTLLAEVAPGSSRYALPVVTVSTIQYRLLIIPTLNITVPASPETDRSIVDWEICYKSLDQSRVKGQTKKIVWKNA